MAKMKEGIFCARCDVEMKPSVLPYYEFEKDYPLKDAQAYKCPNCNNIFFTEEQAHELSSKTDEIKEQTFSFKRKVTISGKSLIVTIPSELAEHLKMKQGQKVKIIPLAKEGFMVKKTH